MPVIQSGNDTIIESNSTATKGLVKLGGGPVPALAADDANVVVGVGCAPSGGNLLQLKGTAPAVVALQRNTALGQGGKDLTLQAGAPKSGEADQPGGHLTLAAGAATGNGTSKVLLQTAGGGSTGAVDSAPATALEVQGDGTVIAGKQAQLAQAATGGFLQIPVIADAPSGAPTLATGKAAIVYCLADHKIYVYLGGTWRSTAALT